MVHGRSPPRALRCLPRRPAIRAGTYFAGDGARPFSPLPAPAGRRRPIAVERPAPPDRADDLPPAVGRFTRRFVYGEGEAHLSFEQGGGHHGSHPHLVHEFVRAIMEDRPAAIDAVTAANWTAAGICAHQSAMAGGAEVVVPAFG